MHHPARILLAALLFLLGTGWLAGQDLPRAIAVPERPQIAYPVPGSHLLREEEKNVRELLRLHPEVLAQGALGKTAWSFTVGSSYQWYADDLSQSPSPRYLVPSTCRAVGTNCYVFVEDASWNSGKVTQAAVDSVREAFDNRTPADPGKGIFQTNVEAFGPPPNVDGDPKIVILILDIKDGFTGSGAFVAGYFYSFNEIPRVVPGYETSNVAEIYFLDCNPVDLSTSFWLDQGMQTAAHEFQHMIHWQHDRDEEDFVNEMCSLTSEIVNGYALYEQSHYNSNTNISLLVWTQSLEDYSRAARYGLYLQNQFGTGLFKPLVASTLNGIAGIDAGLAAIGASRRFNDILPDWLVANTLDDASVDPRYAYTYPNVPEVNGVPYPTPEVPLTLDTVQSRAARYLSFTGGSQLSITFNTSSPSLSIKAVEKGPSGNRLLDVTPGTAFSEPEFGSTYSRIDFVVMNTGEGSPATYDYTATGGGVTALELTWDTGVPVGWLPDSPGDTVCVAFDGVPGARLDSIRVSVSRPGSITGGVWRYTGTPGASPLGSVVIPSFLMAVPKGYAAQPPQPRWNTIDLGSYGASAGLPFAVGFVSAGDHTSQPRVTVEESPKTLPYHSFTYSQVPPGGGAAGWYVYGKNNDTLFIYLIRAYVSTGTADAPVVVELNPRSFSLRQNYPNPFNPSTSIRFAVPRRGNVTLAVYTLLGEHVATLVDEVREAGEYVERWTADGLPSGVYIYRLQAGGASESRKLVLLR